MVNKDVKHERRKFVFVAEEDMEHELGEGLRFTRSLSSLYHVGCEAIKSDGFTEVKLDFPLIKSSLEKVKVIGSFNGLLCLCLTWDDIFLFNPATRERKRIPNFMIDIDLSLDLTDINRPTIYGFGYDNSIDDYNVVKIMYESNVYVYSLKTDTWRRSAQRFSYIGFNRDPCVPLNGAVHWVFFRGVVPYVTSIVAFDFAKGKFQELPRPSDAAHNATTTTVGVLGGCLCCLTRYSSQQDFWMMKEYGLKESWTKVSVILVPFIRELRPLSYLKNDEILLDIDGRLVLYNLREDTHKEFVIQGIEGRRKFEIVTYVESIVSPLMYESGSLNRYQM